MENTQFLPFLALVLAVLGLGYGVGEALLRLARVPGQEPYFRLFLALTLGLTTLVSSYAVLVARGLTILLPLLVLTLLLLRALRRDRATHPDALPAPPAPPESQLGQHAVFMLLAAAALFAVRWGLLYDPDSPFLLTPFQDYIYYGRLSSSLNKTGLETRSLEQLYPQLRQVQPYHYYELWLNALLLRVSTLPAVWCLYLSTYTVLTTVVFAGLRALLAHFSWRGAWARALAAVLLLVSGVYWPAFELHPFAEGGRYVATSLLLLEPKLAPIYIFLLLSLLLVLQRRWQAAGLALAALPLVFITTIPSAVGMAGALVLGLWRRLGRAQRLALALPLLLVLGYLAAFYGVRAAGAQPAAVPVAGASGLLPAAGLPTLLNIFGGTVVNVALYVGGYGLLILLVGWGRFRAGWQHWSFSLVVLLGALAVVVLCGAAARTITSHLPDNYQLLGNVLPPVLTLTLGGMLAALLGPGSRWRRTAALAGLLALAWVNHRRLFTRRHSMHHVTRFSPEFLRQVRAALPQAGAAGGFIMADADFETIYHLTQDTFTRGTYLSNFLSDYALVSLAPPALPSVSTDPRFAAAPAIAAERIRTSSFVRFAELETRQGRHWSRDSAQYQFVVRKGLRFICLAPAVALPATLAPLVQARYRDALSGEVFVVLKQVE